MAENPCRYCVPPKRHPKCHGSCEEYISWREKNIKPRDIDEVTDCLIKSAEKIKKRRGK